MLIRKVIRVYFALMLCLVGSVAAMQNPEIAGYAANVFGALDGAEEMELDTTEFEFYEEDLESDAFFNIDKSWQYYSRPGEQDVSVLKFELFNEHEAVLDSLSLRLQGVDSEMVENIRIYKGDSVVAFAGKVGDYFEFRDIRFGFDEILELEIKADFSDEIELGSRLRFDIESADDLRILSGIETKKVNAIFPIKGPYVTVLN